MMIIVKSQKIIELLKKNFSDLLDNLEEIVGIFGKKRSKFLYSFDLNLFLIILLEIIFIIGFNIALKFL